MKKKFLRTAAAGMSALMLMQNVTAYAAWQRDSNGWKYTNEQGTLEKSNWKWIDGNKDGLAECYYFGKDGYMVTIVPGQEIICEYDGKCLNSKG